jgi:hypothetical protein
MKTITLSFALILTGFIAHAQTQQIKIYCQVYASIGGLKIDYYDLDKVLPDSIKTPTLIDYVKQYHLRNADINNAILVMSTEGWEISSIANSCNGPSAYILSKRISMDGPARQLYLEKLKGK